MVKKAFQNINDWLEDSLRRLVGRITPDKRVVIILVMFFLFGGLSIYMTVSSIYNFGKDKGERLQIERIEALKLQLDEQRRDSINNQINDYEYGKREIE